MTEDFEKANKEITAYINSVAEDIIKGSDERLQERVQIGLWMIFYWSRSVLLSEQVREGIAKLNVGDADEKADK